MSAHSTVCRIIVDRNARRANPSRPGLPARKIFRQSPKLSTEAHRLRLTTPYTFHPSPLRTSASFPPPLFITVPPRTSSFSSIHHIEHASPRRAPVPKFDAQELLQDRRLREQSRQRLLLSVRRIERERLIEVEWQRSIAVVEQLKVKLAAGEMIFDDLGRTGTGEGKDDDGTWRGWRVRVWLKKALVKKGGSMRKGRKRKGVVR